MTASDSPAPNRKLADVVELAFLCISLSVCIFGLFIIIQRPTWPANWRQIVLTTPVVCNAATLPPKLLTLGSKSVFSGITTALLTTVWRMGTLIAVVIIWSATKWLPSEFTAFTLVGCYFPFLILESVHSMKKTNR